jgi:hypothetical protein
MSFHNYAQTVYNTNARTFSLGTKRGGGSLGIVLEAFDDVMDRASLGLFSSSSCHAASAFRKYA